jgi:hypothetical protein
MTALNQANLGSLSIPVPSYDRYPREVQNTTLQTLTPSSSQV